MEKSSQERLLKEIETARDKMHRLSYEKTRTSEEVVKVSTYLDGLLNRYQTILYKKNA
ncbi:MULTISPECIES: aspartyl-phosphate phosphatase Spo0E family protein [Evansella]|jgi:hypothetical protein|uniref:aspartyl-phosphate phosphatase Spo0E family protein n=1 Tax=Evansella TaxID=2837485 RepID=UPI0009986B18|nr:MULTISPECIES: aspartyl-phosphate phosphatase Spo0E family protein [Evansella]UTR12561.1 aspartyl-phosphate phosphatase Spo0E family protein [Evansella sp. LMS18]